MGLFFYNKIGSIITTVILPTTEIIEPVIMASVFLAEKNKKRVWDKIVLSHKKARDSQLWNSSFLNLNRSLIVFKEIIGQEH